MSNYLAVAAVTETLAHIIREAVTPVIPGVLVSTTRPDRAGKDAAPRVNVYLYQATPSPALRNSDLPMRDSAGRLAHAPRTPLNLFYLVTFYGPDEQLVPQQLLALTMSTVHTHAVLGPDTVVAALRSAPNGFLNGSDLGYQRELVTVSPLTMNLEELSKLWQIMFQVPYSLTVAYQASVVMLDGAPVPAALPVHSIGAVPAPGLPPSITGVAGLDGAPLAAGGTAVVSGRGLGGPTAVATLGGVPLATLPGSTDTRVLVLLKGAGLRAGSAALQVGPRTGPPGGPPDNPPRAVGTHDVTLLPVIVRNRVRAEQVERMRDGTRRGTLRLSIRPAPGPGQRVTVLLNALPAAGTTAPAGPAPAFALEVPLPLPAPPARRGGRIDVGFAGVPPGVYAVRVQVDGARSPLASTTGGALNLPSVTIQ
ncbi:MAG TPA: DUF4255 domain-containing protein [Longimicrobium sp.]|jgi:hypothetical protein|uniref:DUF4255 domain-containing protein n=1 Tax=Longimicrobium sp. TaxID=2029185 RepID=UPI002ED85AC0